VWSFTAGIDGQYDAIYEAEEAVVDGARIDDGYLGYTGSGYVDYASDSSDFVEWTVFAHYTGMHRIAFRYAMTGADGALEITANGHISRSALSFPSTGNWDQWAYTQEVPVQLSLGYNTIRATATASKGVNVDHLRVIDEFDYSERPVGVRVYLPLDELVGGTAVDISGNEYDGRLVGDPVWQPSGGVLGGAIEFDGIGDYVEIADFQGIADARARTVGAWIKTNDPGLGDIISWGSDALGRKWSLRTEQSTGAFGVHVSGGSVFGETNVADGAWHHVAAVLDEGRTSVSEVRLYVDGIAETAGSATAQQIATAQSGNVIIGTCDAIRRLYFKGLVDEVVVFDVALTDEQIVRLSRFGGQSFLVPCGRAIEDQSYGVEADINRDCAVNALDFALLAEGWLGDGFTLFGDVQKDEVVDLRDLSVMSDDWLMETTWYGTPAAASEPYPADGEEKVSMRPELSWQASDGAISHDVYFGEVYPPAFQRNQTGTTFKPGLLPHSGTYYWRVDEIGPYGKTVGAVWSFTATSGRVR
jgi:hypothetical protein